MPSDGEREVRSRGRGAPPRERITPIFRHLPRGPHSLDPREIALHQRVRIERAMVEAIAQGGYEQLTVRHVIGLAGVSRRSFYEQFANVHDCFLKTARSVCERELARAQVASRSTSAAVEIVLPQAFATLAAAACERPAPLRLALSESLCAGDTGAVVLGEALCACERLLGEQLARSPGEPLPGGILRALSGALHGLLSAGLREAAPGLPSRLLGEQMCRLALGQRLPSPAVGEELAMLLRDRSRRAALAAAMRSGPAPDAIGSRELMLRGAMRLAARRQVSSLNAAEISEEAGVPLDAFLESFSDARSCLYEALGTAAEPLLAIGRRAHSSTGDWPQAVRLALAGVLGHLAANNPPAVALALVAHRAGPAARQQSRELEQSLGAALLGPAPPGAPQAEAVSGALWHLVRQAILEQRTRLLPALSDHLAYVLLAPTIGAAEAIEALRVGG
jgi:AcrR family transcriptional regulator